MAKSPKEIATLNFDAEELLKQMREISNSSHRQSGPSSPAGCRYRLRAAHAPRLDTVRHGRRSLKVFILILRFFLNITMAVDSPIGQGSHRTVHGQHQFRNVIAAAKRRRVYGYSRQVSADCYPVFLWSLRRVRLQDHYSPVPDKSILWFHRRILVRHHRSRDIRGQYLLVTAG